MQRPLENPITIRLVNKKLLVASTSDKDLVRLVRQLDDSTLEVHLVDGTVYTERGVSNVNDTVLELFGFAKKNLTFKCRFLTKDEESVAKLKGASAREVRETAEFFLDTIFEPLHFLPGDRIISSEMNIHPPKKYWYEDYEEVECVDVDLQISFWMQLDMELSAKQFIFRNKSEMMSCSSLFGGIHKSAIFKHYFTLK